MSQFQGPSQSQVTRIPRRGQRTRGTDFGQTIMPAPPRAGNPAVAVPQGSELKQITGILEGAAKLGTQILKQKTAEERQVRLTERMDRAEGAEAARVDLASHGVAFRADPMKHRHDADGNMNPFGTEVDQQVRDALASIPENETPAFVEGYANNLRVSFSKLVLGHRDAEGARTNETLLAQTAQVLAAGEANTEEVLENYREGLYVPPTDQQWDRIVVDTFIRAAEIHGRNAVEDGPYPRVQNDDGTWSSVKLGTISEDGWTYVIPFMWGGVQHDRETAIKNARDRGLEFFPRFKSGSTDPRHFTRDPKGGQPTDGPIVTVREHGSADEQAQQWIEENHSVAHEILPPPADWDYGQAGVDALLDKALERGEFALKSVEAAEDAIADMQGPARAAEGLYDDPEKRRELGMPLSKLHRLQEWQKAQEIRTEHAERIEKAYKEGPLNAYKEWVAGMVLDQFLSGKAPEETHRLLTERGARLGIKDTDIADRVVWANGKLETRANAQVREQNEQAEQAKFNNEVDRRTDILSDSGIPPVLGQIFRDTVPVEESGVEGGGAGTRTPGFSRGDIDRATVQALKESIGLPGAVDLTGPDEDNALFLEAGFKPQDIPQDEGVYKRTVQELKVKKFTRALRAMHADNGFVDEHLKNRMKPLVDILNRAMTGQEIPSEALDGIRPLVDNAIAMYQLGILSAYTDPDTAESVLSLGFLIHSYGMDADPRQAMEKAIRTLPVWESNRETAESTPAATIEEVLQGDEGDNGRLVGLGLSPDNIKNKDAYKDTYLDAQAFLINEPPTSDRLIALADELFKSRYAILEDGTIMEKGYDSWITDRMASIAKLAMIGASPDLDDKSSIDLQYNPVSRELMLVVDGIAQPKAMPVNGIRELARLAQIRIDSVEATRSTRDINEQRIKEHRKEYHLALRKSGIYKRARLPALVEVPSYEQWAEDNPPDLVDAGKHIESGAFDDAVARNPDLEPYIRAVQKNAPVPPPAMTAKRIVAGTVRAFKKDIQSDVAWWKKLWKNIGWLGEEMYGDYPEAYTEWPWRVGPMPPGVGQRTRTEGIFEQTLRLFGSRNEWNDWYPQQQLEHAAKARERMQQGVGGAR
ncbi:MAG TPA: hypothetical protein DCE43_08090 [Planctomycetaceae bacterium]|nr:hypothetical protein [Planctomycetaceae bacterium]